MITRLQELILGWRSEQNRTERNVTERAVLSYVQFVGVRSFEHVQNKYIGFSSVQFGSVQIIAGGRTELNVPERSVQFADLLKCRKKSVEKSMCFTGVGLCHMRWISRRKSRRNILK